MSNPFAPYGSASFATYDDVRNAGMFRQGPYSLYVGELEGRPLWYHGAGGLLTLAGARAGKLRDILAYNACSGIYEGSIIFLDMKGELAMISQDQTPDGKSCFYWNPNELHGLPSVRLNPLDYCCKGSRTLVSDVKKFTFNLIPEKGGEKEDFFGGRAREYLEALSLFVIERRGVLSYPELYRIIKLAIVGNDEWLDISFDMKNSSIDSVRDVEGEIKSGHEDSSGGFRGIMGELAKSVSALSDPAVMATLSPPYNFSLSDLTKSDQNCQVYLMISPDMVGPWGPIIKTIFEAAKIYKFRAPSAPEQLWVLDECAQLKRFPLVAELYSIGAGMGIKVWAIFQSFAQMKSTAEQAEKDIPASAGFQQYFKIRELDTAKHLSDMCGTQTLYYEDIERTEKARQQMELAEQALLNGGDYQEAMMSMDHAGRLEHLPAQRARKLKMPEEILSMGDHEQLVFADGVSAPIWANRKPYYEQRFMAGRYHPNPFHPPLDKVKVKSWLGHRWKPVITEEVPAEFSHLPQYRNGQWSYIG